MDAQTPKLTDHARARCAEMGVSTKVVKAIVRDPSMVYPGPAKHGENWIATSDRHPEYAVAFVVRDNGKVICTVLYNRRVFTRD